MTPPGDGWQEVYPPHHVPPRGVLLELWRREWGDDTTFSRWDDLHPAFNIANLWWRVADG